MTSINQAATQWLHAQSSAREIAEKLSYPDAFLDYEDAEQYGMANDPDRAGQLEDELNKVLRERGLRLEPESCGYRIRWDGAYVVARGADAADIVDVVYDRQPDLWEYATDDLHLSLWRSCDYFDVRNRGCGPIETA